MPDRSPSTPPTGRTPEPVEPQSSEPTTFLGAPNIGVTDHTTHRRTGSARRAWDDMPAAWLNAFGSAK